MIDLKKILVATDFSHHSTHALLFACEIAEKFGAELHVLHVVHDPAVAHPEIGLSMLPLSEFREEIENTARTKLDELTELDSHPNLTITRELRIGTPFIEIVRYTKDNGIDLVVVGTHGRNALAQMLIGSVAEKVVRKAPCTVLAVRHPDHEFVMPWARV